MLRSVKELIGYELQAKDGAIGRCKDFLFDDERWTIRYLVAETGSWLTGRKVLISPVSLGKPDWPSRLFPVELTKKQIEDSPGLDADAPVSRQYELKWNVYFGLPAYWAGPDIWGAGPYPSTLLMREPKPAATGTAPEEVPEESHLRSFKEVTGYYLRAADGEIGYVEDFIVDEALWLLRYMVVDTRNLLPGRKVLVAPTWVKSVDWHNRHVTVDLTVEAVKNSPEYDPAAPVNREYETRLYDYYGRPYYWL